MNRAFALKWAADLERPGLKQTTGKLHSNKGFCCLGRACVVAGLRGKLETSPLRDSVYLYQEEEHGLPPSVQTLFNIASSDGSRRDGKTIKIGGHAYASLATANDSGVSFKDIAAYIRKNYKYL